MIEPVLFPATTTNLTIFDLAKSQRQMPRGTAPGLQNVQVGSWIRHFCLPAPCTSRTLGLNPSQSWKFNPPLASVLAVRLPHGIEEGKDRMTSRTATELLGRSETTYSTLVSPGRQRYCTSYLRPRKERHINLVTQGGRYHLLEGKWLLIFVVFFFSTREPCQPWPRCLERPRGKFRP